MLRRNFIAQLGAAGAAAAAVPSILRADGANAPAQPRDVARLAFAGVRGRGSELMKEFAGMKDVKVVAIVDPDENVIAKALKIAADSGNEKPRYEKDIRKILEDKMIDAVVVATPNHWHTLTSIWALQAGKHVYCEKPVSQNCWEGARMVEAAQKYNRVCMTGTQNRSSGSNKAGIEYMKAGKLGKVKLGRAIVYRKRDGIGKKTDGPVPAGVDYNIWQGAASERPFNPNRFHYEWHWNWDYGNGELGNNGIHALDVVRWGLGKNDLPRRILSLGGRYGFNDDGQTPNTHVIWYDYGDCQMICEIRNYPSEEYHPTKPDVIFHCENGILAKAGGNTMTAYDLKWNKIETFPGGNNHYRRFIDAVKKGSLDDPGNFILEGHLSTAICHLGNISHRVGCQRPFDGAECSFQDNEALRDAYQRMVAHLQKNNIDVKTEKLTLGKMLEYNNHSRSFSGDARASALLRREYRAPFVVPEKV